MSKIGTLNGGPRSEGMGTAVGSLSRANVVKELNQTTLSSSAPSIPITEPVDDYAAVSAPAAVPAPGTTAAYSGRERILLCHPDLEGMGGIQNGIRKIKKYLGVETESVILARRPGEARGIPQALRLIKDYRRFHRMVSRGGVGLVHLHPSLESKGFLREGLYARTAAHYGSKTIVFFRGWRKNMERLLNTFPWLFRLLYGRVDAFMVFGADFELCLRRWGVTQPIFREVNTVDDEILADFDLEAALDQRRTQEEAVVLFAGRVTHKKGVFKVIDAVARLREHGHDVRLVVAGDGPDLGRAVERAHRKLGTHVEFLGSVPPEEMAEVYARASLLCFPSQSEGLPNVLVEAMAYGLPCVTSNVGAICEIFRHETNGLIVDPHESPDYLADALQSLLTDPTRMEMISRRNFAQAQDNFLASQSAERWESIYGELVALPSGSVESRAYRKMD